MSAINFSEEAKRLEEGERKAIFKGKDFHIMLQKGLSRLHACGADEFLYVVEGQGELLIEDQLHLLNAGEGAVVEAGKKHRRGTPGVTWLVIAKQPHKHIFYEDKL